MRAHTACHTDAEAETTMRAFIAIALLLASCSQASTHITHYHDGSYFVPPNSALGPLLSHVKIFITYHGTVCTAVGPEGAMNGLVCKPKRR